MNELPGRTVSFSASWADNKLSKWIGTVMGVYAAVSYILILNY